MKKLFLSFLALSVAILTWAYPSGTYHVSKALLHYCSGYSFSGGEEWELTSGDDEDAWDVDITVNEDGSCSVYNLLDWEETLTANYNAPTGKLIIPVQVQEFEAWGMGVCGGINGYITPKSLMDYIDSKSGYVSEDVLSIAFSYDEEANTLTLDTPILTYVSYDYPGYVGYVSEDYTQLISGMVLEPAPEGVTITVNDAEGVQVYVDTEDDKYLVAFEDNKAQVQDAQFVTIYSVDPYVILSVLVDGEKIDATDKYKRSYFVEVTEETKSIAIEVEEQTPVDMTMYVYVEGLKHFEDLVILDKDGENGKAIASKMNLEEGEATQVHFTNFDVPFQIYGTWADGTDYKMSVTLNGHVLPAVAEGPTSAQFMDVEPKDGQMMTIALKSDKHIVDFTVNAEAGVEVIADTADGETVTLNLNEGKDFVADAQYIKIYNVKPYVITSVKVNGEEIAAEEAGEYYFIEVTEGIESIDIMVEEVEVVEMSMNVTVEGLGKFQSLAILDKKGETGKALAMESQLKEGEPVQVWFDNFDLPLQVYGTWADGNDYTMTVTLNDVELTPVVSGPTSAQFVDINAANEANMVISLTGSAIPAEEVTLTVNEAAGVSVLVDVEDANFAVEFTDGEAVVEAPQVIRIYNVKPYIISSVKVNDVEIAAEEGGEYYYIEPNVTTKTIAIEVEEVEVIDMVLNVTVEGLDKFQNLAILDKTGEGQALAMESQLKEGEAVPVHYSQFELPLQVIGTWAAGYDYTMTVTLDGEELTSAISSSTSAQFIDIEPAENANMVISLTGSAIPAEKVTLTVNEAAGVNVIAETEDDVINVEFTKGEAVVEAPQYIRIYNVKPYIIESVKVNGEEIAAVDGGEYYYIEPNAATETIAIEVKEVEVVDMVLNVTVEGLDKFENLAILDKTGEGQAIAMESQLKDGEAVPVHYDNFDLPLQVFGSWAAGYDYTMTVTLDGEELPVISLGTTSAQCVNIEPAENANMVISLTGAAIPAEKVTLTVNEAAGVNVLVDTEDGNSAVEFTDGEAVVEAPQVIRIYNVEPYIISSVKVNGEEIAAVDGGEYYFIEPNVTTETIAIEVEEVEVVEMSMMVYVQGIDKFKELVIMDKNGENGKALAHKDQLAADAVDGEVLTDVYFTNFDLPLQVFGTWADGTDYKMAVTVDGEPVVAVQEGETSALFMNIDIANEQFLTISLTGSILPAEEVTLTVNEAAGVNVLVDTEDDNFTVEFTDGEAVVEAPQVIRIYNVEPYLITSVKVNGEEIAAEEGGEYYFIEPNAATKTIEITVEEQEVVEMSMMVTVEGLDKFQNLAIMSKGGETGKAIAMEANFTEGVAAPVWFTNFDLPLQVYGTWADGTDYKMNVTLDGEALVPVMEGPTSAQFINIEPAEGANMVISLTGSVLPAEEVTLTVNEAAGVNVLVDTEEDVINVLFVDGEAVVEAPQYIRIYNVEPYLITSVKVNGEEIAAEEGGEYYFIEPNAATKTIAIEVEEQEVVEMYMNVTVEGLDKFQNLAIMSKGGETGKAIAMEANFTEGEAQQVWFNNFDLPLQVYGTWADGTDYKMNVTLDGEALVPVMEGPTSAQFINIEPAEGANMVISLTGSVLPAEEVTLTVNEAAGVNVMVDTEEDVINVLFVDGEAVVEAPQFIRIYNVAPYLITSVKVNGEEIAAEEGGEYYFIEPNAATKTIEITVEEQEVVEMSMMVTVEGLDKFQNLAIMGKAGEGYAIAMEANFTEGVAAPVWFTNFDLPLQVFGSWADGTNYKMTVTLDGEELVPVMEGPTSAQFINIEPAEGANMVISLTGSVLPAEEVTLTVNEAAGVNVMVDTEEDVINVEFVDGKAVVDGPQYIRIYNVDPYIITSVKVNGEEIAAEEGGRFYFIEPNAATKTIDITVEEQETVEMSMLVYVNGLEKFEKLVIQDKDGELGKAIASKENFEAESFDGSQALVEVWFTNFDLPLQVYGEWEEGNDYKMEVTIEGVEVPAVQEGPTSALFMDIYVENEQFLTIELKGETSAINKVDAEQKAGKWYNLQGIEVSKANLMPGNVYINGGHKYLVK